MVRWPDGFGTRFAVFVDTEEEFDWSRPFTRRDHGTRAMRALPDLHALFVAHGVPATFMIDHPIATCAESVDILNALLGDGGSAIATQLHPWVTPPFEEAVTPRNSFAGNLPRDLERAKIETITRAVAHAFGARPRMFRTGRYGLGPNTLRLLAEAGYRVDSSMRSGYDYSADGGADFRDIPNAAFRTGHGDLVELPLTTVYTGALRRGGRALHRLLRHIDRGPGLAARLGLLSRVALTPEDMPIADAIAAIRIAAQAEHRLLLFSYHSPSAAPGHTPYVRDAADLRAFRAWWEAAFAELARLNIAPASHDDILAALDAAR
ncbi:WalW protein [Sphingomonas sp.]|uniref:WalW protein n=1 Tax=Sphingomonas sp. TaxID=28214 RepID=UPI001EB84FB2|nr:WalW protein [Sphingomonas sp.]MBX3594063.1 WalW protein [Sphingomonas sp.]